MRIVFDVSPLAVPRTGIGNYVRGAVQGLLEASGGRHEIVAFSLTGAPGARRLAAVLPGAPLERRLHAIPGARYWRRVWSRVGRPPVERLAGTLDVFHFSDWMYPAQRGGLRTTTIHDLVPLRFPELVQRMTLRLHLPKYRNAARTCDLIFTNSHFTASEVTELLAFPRERIRVAYPGIDPRFSPEGRAATLAGPYVLAVATVEPRKNLRTLVEAYRILRARLPEVRLAIAGAIGWGRDVSVRDPGVVPLGYVPDDELAALYRGASAFAYPSTFEGFGMPVVEALASGTPAVVSAHPSLDEASADAALRADPNSPEAFADALERALEPDDERRRRGLAHARRFTWRACGEAVLGGYEGVTDCR